MKALTKAIIPTLVSGSLLMGCVSNPTVNDSTEGGTVTSESTASDTQQTKTEGAVLGALLGGLIGLATGDEKGAAIGAVLGAGIGYAVGSEVAKRKQEYATTEEFLDAEIARTAEFNETARAQHQRMKKEIAALDKETVTLQKQYRSGEASKKQLRAKRKDLEAKLAKNKEFEDILQKEFEINTEILAQESKERPANDPYLSKLEKENNDLKAQIEQLRKDSAQLAQINERLSV